MASNLITNDEFQTAQLDRALRATLALVGGDPEAAFAEERVDAIIVAALASGRVTSVTIAADSDADVDERIEQLHLAGCRSHGCAVATDDAQEWRHGWATLEGPGGKAIDVLVRGPKRPAR